MDACTPIDRAAFFHILERLVVELSPAILETLPWRPRIDLALFVHRIDGLAPGLYFLVRQPDRMERCAALSARSSIGCVRKDAHRRSISTACEADVRSLARNVS